MLTYNFEKNGGTSLYEQLYQNIKRDILAGKLAPDEKLPSKRMLAEHLKLSVVTVKNAYEQLIAEGYLYSREKRGYYVTPIEKPLTAVVQPMAAETPQETDWFLDFATNSTAAEYFPFTIWAKLMRRTILEQDTGLLRSIPTTGATELRQAIADYLRQERGMIVTSEQIIVGAGTEWMYHLLVQLLGREKCYAVEEPGYSKIARIYENNGVDLQYIGLDDSGLSAKELAKSGADVVHISPSHHYPTGIVMPISRRQELLRWAAEKPGRYILEDEYDSEFRFTGHPIPTMYAEDKNQCVIYLNTFSKTIAPSIRISYMILPVSLLEEYRGRLGFYACTVSGFEQYTLAQFLTQGSYEQHLNRMRKRYRQKRDAVIVCIETGALKGRATIMERGAGLHFLVQLKTEMPDGELREKAAQQGLRLALLSDYYENRKKAPAHVWVVNYSGLALERLPEALERLAKILEENDHV